LEQPLDDNAGNGDIGAYGHPGQQHRAFDRLVGVVRELLSMQLQRPVKELLKRGDSVIIQTAIQFPARRELSAV
jgi:hypothetical protein